MHFFNELAVSAFSTLILLYIVVLGCVQTSHLNFCFGLSVGLVISFLIASFSSLQTPLILTRKYAANQFDSYLSSRSLQEVAGTYEEMHEEMDKRLSKNEVKEVLFEDDHKHHGGWSRFKKKKHKQRLKGFDGLSLFCRQY